MEPKCEEVPPRLPQQSAEWQRGDYQMLYARDVVRNTKPQANPGSSGMTPGTPV